MMHQVYYLCVNGELYNRDQVRTAFEFSTGKLADDEPAFLKWLWNLFGVSIVKIVVDPTEEDFINYGRRVWAIKAYRDKHKCGLAEAKKAIDAKYPWQLLTYEEAFDAMKEERKNGT